MISIGDSSIPFRALLGAILSVVKRISVEPSEFNPDMKLDSIVEEQAVNKFRRRNVKRSS